jgi:DNA-binding GntR family transcriptional regulator
MSSKTRKTRLSERVKHFLLSQYGREDVTWNEEKLAGKFHVSRTPIRDALHELEKQGIILRRQKRGIVLRILSPKEISEVYEVREALEKLAVERAIENVTAGDIQSLKKIVSEINRAIRKKDILLIDKADAKFHAKLFEISGNQYLRAMIDQFDLLIRAFYLSSRFVDSPEFLRAPGHEEIIEALERRDKRTCLKLIHRHIHNSKKFLLKQKSDL